MHQAAHDLLVVLITFLLEVLPLLRWKAEQMKAPSMKGSHLSAAGSQLSHLEAVLPLDLALGGVGTDPLAHAGQQVADCLRGRDDVERRRQRALVVKVAQPEFGSGELPLLVLVVLPREGGQK